MFLDRVFSRRKVPNLQDGPALDTAVDGGLMPSQTELLFILTGQGDVVRSYPCDQPDLAMLRKALPGRGLFHSLRVSDRPAFVKAVSDTHFDDVPRQIQLIVHHDDIMGGLPCQLQVKKQAAHLLGVLKIDEVQHDTTTDGLHQTSLIAHEFRAPLTSIQGFAELLVQDAAKGDALQDSSRLQGYANMIVQSTQHLTQVVDRCLTLGEYAVGRGQQALNVDDICVASFMDECRAIITPHLTRKNLSLHLIKECELETCCVDALGLKQALVNLLDNACKFSDEGGTIHLHIDVMDSHVHFRIEDDGMGIPDHALARLGRPFERVANTGVPGTGLGLAIVEQFASLHGGRLNLESVLGVGTTATLILPKVRGAGHYTPSSAMRSNPYQSCNRSGQLQGLPSRSAA